MSIRIAGAVAAEPIPAADTDFLDPENPET
jgi:hypothetical protein